MARQTRRPKGLQASGADRARRAARSTTGREQARSIKVHTLGRFAITVDDEPIRFNGKTQKRPLDLAKALVGLGTPEAPVFGLVGALWPEADGCGPKALEVTVYRLRRLLRSPDAVRVSNQCVMLDPACVWVDAWVVEGDLRRLVPPPGGIEPDPDALKAAAASIVELYRGHFLPMDGNTRWTYPMRDRLWSLCQRYFVRLGEAYERHGAWDEATRLYEHAIALDPTAETFYRQLMRVCQHLGARGEAIRVYHRCCQALSVMLGAKPSAETEQLRASLSIGEN
jgi:DNA-binding SARP family transcriptional activator